MNALHIEVCGHVQGVGFRYCCCREARALGVTGWVRNRADGSVEIVAEGPDAALAAFEGWCRQGPPGAAVACTAVRATSTTGAFVTFEIR